MALQAGPCSLCHVFPAHLLIYVYLFPQILVHGAGVTDPVLLGTTSKLVVALF